MIPDRAGESVGPTGRSWRSALRGDAAHLHEPPASPARPPTDP
jgi:hypothetical protein